MFKVISWGVFLSDSQTILNSVNTSYKLCSKSVYVYLIRDMQYTLNYEKEGVKNSSVHAIV